MWAPLQSVQELLARITRQRQGPAASLPVDDASLVVCRVCEGSGNCRVCGGDGTVERLVAVAGADAGMVREPAQQMQIVKCRACPGSSGTCRACKGKGKVPPH